MSVDKRREETAESRLDDIVDHMQNLLNSFSVGVDMFVEDRHPRAYSLPREEREKLVEDAIQRLGAALLEDRRFGDENKPLLGRLAEFARSND